MMYTRVKAHLIDSFIAHIERDTTAHVDESLDDVPEGDKKHGYINVAERGGVVRRLPRVPMGGEVYPKAVVLASLKRRMPSSHAAEREKNNYIREQEECCECGKSLVGRITKFRGKFYCDACLNPTTDQDRAQLRLGINTGHGIYQTPSNLEW